MALYRCAACGSPNVILDKQAAGVEYNYLKGTIGTIALGAGGAVAGLQSKTSQVYICQDCGVTLTYPMPENIKNAIDLGLISETHRDFLKIEGVGEIGWSALKRHYKNIEEGFADKNIKQKANTQNNSLLSYATATQEEFDKAVDLIVDYQSRLLYSPENSFNNEHHMTLADYYIWHDAIALFIENMAKYLPFPLKNYRGFSQYSMLQYFGAYLVEKVRIEFGHYPRFSFESQFVSEDFCEYAKKNPFVIYFANKYLNRSYNSPFTGERVEEFWEPTNFAEILRYIDSPHSIPTLAFLSFSSIKSLNIWKSLPFPRFVIENGMLYYWSKSYEKGICLINGEYMTELMDEYFNTYPEKREKYDKKIEEHKQQLITKKTNEGKAQLLESKINRINTEIQLKEEKIVQLKNKIFGKKRAIEQANILMQEISEMQTDRNKTASAVKVLNAQIASVLDEKSFSAELVKEMNYFIILNKID